MNRSEKIKKIKELSMSLKQNGNAKQHTPSMTATEEDCINLAIAIEALQSVSAEECPIA